MTTIKSIRLMGGYMDTRKNKHDFAITPYFSLVHAKQAQVYGIALTWGFWSVYIGIGINTPKEVKSFVIFKP